MNPDRNDNDANLKSTNDWPGETTASEQPEIVIQPTGNQPQSSAENITNQPSLTFDDTESTSSPEVIAENDTQKTIQASEPTEEPLAVAPTPTDPELAPPTKAIVMPDSPTSSSTPATVSTSDSAAPPTFSPTPSPASPKDPRRKKLIIAMITLLVILLGLVGYVFGYYIPNKPENVWRTGFDRTGKALDAVSDSLIDKKNIEQLSQSAITADYDIRYGDSRYEGSLETLFNESEGTYSAVIKNDNNGEKQELTIDAITHHDAKKTFPDIFLKFNGLAMFEGSSYVDILREYENRWIAADEEYFSTLLPEEQEEAKKPELTHDDYIAFAQAAKSATNEFVFTSDHEKAILVQKSIVGPEKIHDTNTYKYKAGLSEKNLQRYCEALLTRLVDTPGFKKVPYVEEDKIDEYKEDIKESCNESIDVSDVELDVWVDRKHKLLHQIGYQVEDGPYTSVGQTYTGGDIFSIFINVKHDKDGDKADATYTVEVNIKTLVTKAKLTAEFDFDNEKSSAEANFQSKPHKNDIKAATPNGVVPIQEIIEKIQSSLEASYGSWDDDSQNDDDYYYEDDLLFEDDYSDSSSLDNSSSYFQ